MPVRDRTAPTLVSRLKTPEGEFRVVTDRIISMSYVDSERKADVVKLEVDNHDLSQFDDPMWRKGGEITLSWGYPGAMTPERTLVITTVKGFRPLQIEATAKSVLMNRNRQSRTFENVRISDVAKQIAEEYGYGSDAQHIDETDETVEVVTQSRRTDAEFLRHWASRLGYEFFVDFDGFHFHPRRLGEAPVRAIRFHSDPNLGDVVGDPSIDNDLTARPGRVRVTGRNPEEREDIDESADNRSDSSRDTVAPVVEIIDGEDGSTVGFTDGGLGSEDVVPASDDTPAQAQMRARGRFRRTQQVAVKMSLTIVGDPLMLAKTIVQVEGMGKRLSVKYYVQEVEHSVSSNGYTSKLKLVSDGHGGHSTRSTVARGLELLSVGGSGRRRRGSTDAVTGSLETALRAAEAAGDEDSAAMIRRAQEAYSRGGDGSSAQVDQILGTVARNSTSPEVQRAATEARGGLSQTAGEVSSGGRVNERDTPEEGGAELEAVQSIDPEDGSAFTTYRQTTGRGTTSQ